MIMRSIALVAMLLPSVAAASIFDIYGFNPRGTAMGNAQAAAADDFTATFYNPGALTQRKRVHVGAGFVATFPRLHIDREFASADQRGVDNELPPDFSGFNMGALFPIGGLIGNRVAIGIAMYLPTNNLIRGEGIDPQVPQFYRYQNLPDKYVILAAAAFEFTPWLSAGLGAQVLAGLDGQVSVELDLANRRVGTRSVVVDLGPTAAPTAGVLVQPLGPDGGLRVGASWRSAIQLDYALPSVIIIGDVLNMALDIHGTVLYSPHYINFGASHTFERIGLTASGEVSYALWSRAPDPSPKFGVDVQGDLIDGLGLGENLDVGSGAPVDLNFRNVAVYKIGFEHRPNETLAMRAGYTFRPTPAPVPEDAFNYVDNTAHILSFGAGVSFRDPLEIRQSKVHLDLVYQATLLTDEDVVKRTDALDPVGDYTAGGTIHSVGIAFRHDL